MLDNITLLHLSQLVYIKKSKIHNQQLPFQELYWKEKITKSNLYHNIQIHELNSNLYT